MKVSVLIEVLEKVDQNLNVFFWSSELGHQPVEAALIVDFMHMVVLSERIEE